MSTIVASQLTQRFGSELALDSVDLVLDAGEHLAVLGENGAGKTTLLRILATASRPSSGQLEIFGLDATRERRRLRSRIGFVSHAPGLYPALSPTENLEFFCTLQGVDRGRVAETLGLVGLSDVAHRPAGLLSRGMQQRLAIGRAVLHDPKLLVLDEPDASLGSDGPDLLAKIMRGKTAVLATHDHALANRLCQRTMVLRNGRSLGAGTRWRVVR
ncbi:MAG TPA: heme ABC exporter ATP-binding protein CcmA [Candidatus Dormibacteraeota bacterium]|nr:heme ABC exporter ATP-binding protein CcmA [Candidatus Dormibacteraeota bacterium]